MAVESQVEHVVWFTQVRHCARHTGVHTTVPVSAQANLIEFKYIIIINFFLPLAESHGQEKLGEAELSMRWVVGKFIVSQEVHPLAVPSWQVRQE